MNHRTKTIKLLSVLMTVCILLTGIPMVAAVTAKDLSKSALPLNGLSNVAQSLYDETYKSLTGRITDRGYTETSLTGAYSGMYLRDSAIQIMAQNAYGDYHLSREMLQFIMGQHQDLGWQYTQHILGSFNETNYDNTYLTITEMEPEPEPEPEFEYLGCTELGGEHWNIQTDYIWAPFATNADYVEAVKAYVRVFAGTGTLTVALCTGYYGKGEVLGTATLECNFSDKTKGWQTLTFDQPVAVNPGQVYYLRFGSDDVKATLWGKDSATANDPWAEHVDDGRKGTGWSNNRLVNFEIISSADTGVETYLGCTEIGAEHWNIQNDYIWAPFATAANYVEQVNAYVRVFAGTGTLTVALCTDYYGKGEVLGTATLNCNYTTATKGWQTLTFDQPVAVNPGQVYYLRFGSDNVKATLWGKDSATADDPWAEHVDDGRKGTGWSNNRLVNFEIAGSATSEIDAYLGCTEIGSEQWNIQSDYVYGAFVPDIDTIDYVKAYVKVRPGAGSLTAAICTDVYGKGEILGTATLSCNYSADAEGWQTLTFDTPVAVKAGETYYLRLGSDDVKVTLWGAATDGDDNYRSYVDAGRAGSGWRTAYLPNFEIPSAPLDQDSVIITLDGDTAGLQVVPVLDNEKISSLRVILSRDESASGTLKATLSKGYGDNAVRVDWFEMDVEEIPVGGDWVKLSFSLPINKVDASQDYSLKLELVNAEGKVYWHGTTSLDQHGTFTVQNGQYVSVKGDASFEAYKTSGASMWSKEIQPDGNYMFIHAWYQYAMGCVDNEDNRIFIAESYPVIKMYADYYLDNGYIGSNGLMRNPYFEHSREGRKWNAYDLITNVFASQALYEMSSFAAAYGDTASATKWSAASASLTEAIAQHLIVEYDGVTIYAELYDIDSGDFIPGISWVNLAPMAAEWYAMDNEIMQNTLDLYGVYATAKIRGYDMLHTNGTLGVVKDGVSVIGKGLSWEIMYYHAIDNKDREEYLLSFIETVAAECGVYPENYRNDRLADPGNQEHASWQFYAVSFVYPELTKNYSLDQLAKLVQEANAVDVDRLREESLGEPLDNVYALKAKAEKALMTERITRPRLTC